MAVAVSPGLPQTATWADRAAVIHYRAADTAPDTSMARASPAQAAQQPSAVADTPQLQVLARRVASRAAGTAPDPGSTGTQKMLSNDPDQPRSRARGTPRSGSQPS